jgi:hypothetical protein
VNEEQLEEYIGGLPTAPPEIIDVAACPELADCADDLANLSIDTVLIQSGNDGRGHAVVTFRGIDCSQFHWALAARSSAADARVAAISFLRGVAGARQATRSAHPWPDPASLSNLERQAAVHWALHHKRSASEGWRVPDRVDVIEQIRERHQPRARQRPKVDRPAPTEWGARVRAARNALGLTQAQLGAECGLNQAQVSQLERQGDGTGAPAERLSSFLKLEKVGP